MQEHQATAASVSLWAPSPGACLFSYKPRPNQHFSFQASFPSSPRSQQFFLPFHLEVPSSLSSEIIHSADSCLLLHSPLDSEASQNEANRCQRSDGMFTSVLVLTTSPNLMTCFRISGTPVSYSLQFQSANSKLIKTEQGSFLLGVLLKGKWHF